MVINILLRTSVSKWIGFIATGIAWAFFFTEGDVGLLCSSAIILCGMIFTWLFFLFFLRLLMLWINIKDGEWSSIGKSLQDKTREAQYWTERNLLSHYNRKPHVYWKWAKKVKEVASKKRDFVWRRLQESGYQPFKYHLIDNVCYKSYTHPKSLKKFHVRNTLTLSQCFLINLICCDFFYHNC